MKLGLCGLAAAALVACGGVMPEQVELAVVDHGDALSTGAGDKLFTLTLSTAEKSFSLNDISVNAGIPGQTPTVVEFIHTDTNGNGLLDPGETLSCSEPPVNLFDPSTLGKAVSVSFAERTDGMLFELGSATWTPAN